MAGSEYTVTVPEPQGQDKYSISPPASEFTVSLPQPQQAAAPAPPQDYIHAGPATPTPRVPEEGKQSTGDWLLDALLSPNTLIGHLLHPTKEPSKQENVESKMSGMPVMGQRPLLDPSVGIEEPFTKGMVQSIGGMTAPAQLPFMAAPASKAISAMFAATTVPQLMDHYQRYDQYKKEGNEKAANAELGAMTSTMVIGSMAAYHAGSIEGAVPPQRFNLTPDELKYTTNLIQNHLEQSAANGDHAGVEDAVHGLAAILPNISAEHTPKGREVIHKSMIEETIKNDERAIAATTDPAEKARLTEHMKDFQEMLREPATVQATKDIQKREGEPPGGPVHAPSSEAIQSTEAQGPREENLRLDQPASRGGGSVEGSPGAGAVEEGAGREASEGELASRLGELHSILPDFQRATGGEEEAAPLPAEGHGVQAEEQPPVISRAVDDDLADHGIQVRRPGPDIGRIETWGGAFTETARRLNTQGHPLGPTLISIARAGVDAIKGMTRLTIDTLGGWKREAKVGISDKEWQAQVVPLLKDSNVTISNRPPNTPDNIWKSYSYTRSMLDTLRTGMRDSIRQRLTLAGLPKDFIQGKVPDDWGIPFGYYPGIFEGDYAITKYIGVDEHGVEQWEPIETGWRDTSEAKALKKAESYIKANPGTQIRVQRDTYTLPGKDFSSRSKLIELTKKLKDTDNADLDELVASLYNEAASAAYGPTRIAPRQYGHALRREVDLPGGATDMESFERFIAGSIRFIHLSPAREAMLQLRNKLADIAGMPEIQRPSDVPGFSAYSQAHQYGNILSRTDQFINGVEGRPGFSDVEFRSALNSIGADPSIMSRLSRATQEAWALMKLGFSPVKILSHGLQSLWAARTVLGDRYSLEGLVHAYNPAYNDLIRAISPSEPKANPLVGGIEGLANLVTGSKAPNSFVDAIHSYKADYFSRGTGPIDWTKGTYQLLRDIGMSPFASGIESTRRLSAVGAYRQALAKGMPEAQARSYASIAVDRISGLYHSADNPVALRQLPGPVAQFKTFSFKTAQFMYGLRAPMEWFRFLQAIGILGYAGLPMLKSFSGLIYSLTGENIENDLKRKFPRLSRGIFGAAGVDIPPGVGLGDLGLTRSQAPLGGILGPAGSDIYSLAKGGIEKAVNPVSRTSDQDLKDAIRNLSPVARRIVDEHERMATTPSTIDPRTGSTILHDLTPLERLESILGFTPLKVAEERESHEYIRNALLETKDKRGWHVDKLAENQLELMRPGISESQRVDLLKETLDLQRSAQEHGVAQHLVPAVRERIKEMLMDRLERDLRKAPKGVRPLIWEERQRFLESQR